MDHSPNLELPYIAPSQAQKHVTHNEAVRMLDALVQLGVIDRDLATPPVSPSPGDRYIVAPGSTGAWMSRDDSIAFFAVGAWSFLEPRAGWLAWVADEGILVAFDGSAWTHSAAASVNPVAMVGVNATATTTNRLTVKSPATLLDHDGAGHSEFINKASSSETASVLFQTGYSGRAQLGLCGSDDLSIKISPDGSAWTEVLRGDRTSGEVTIDQMRIGRDMVANTLPDSGRFNGNANPTVFSGITYTAPTYLAPVAGGSFAAHAKFIHNNNDYGGAAGALDADVKALIDKIRALASRRFGAEWYVMLVSNSTSALTGSVSISGTNFGIALSNVTIALPAKFTVGYYVKAKTGSTAIAVDLVKRATIDGVSVPAGAGATPVVLTPADGWKYINLECSPNVYGYDVRMLQLLLPLSGQLLLAMPRLVFGHMSLDPNRGILGNFRPFG